MVKLTPLFLQITLSLTIVLMLAACLPKQSGAFVKGFGAGLGGLGYGGLGGYGRGLGYGYYPGFYGRGLYGYPMYGGYGYGYPYFYG